MGCPPAAWVTRSMRSTGAPGCDRERSGDFAAGHDGLDAQITLLERVAMVVLQDRQEVAVLPVLRDEPPAGGDRDTGYVQGERLLVQKADAAHFHHLLALGEAQADGDEGAGAHHAVAGHPRGCVPGNGKSFAKPLEACQALPAAGPGYEGALPVYPQDESPAAPAR